MGTADKPNQVTTQCTELQHLFQKAVQNSIIDMEHLLILEGKMKYTFLNCKNPQITAVLLLFKCRLFCSSPRPPLSTSKSSNRRQFSILWTNNSCYSAHMLLEASMPSSLSK